MSDMEILSELIKVTALVSLQGDPNKPRVILQEPEAPDSTATISYLPSDAFVIKVDAFRSPGDIFNGNMGECKRADYVIISPRKKCVLYIELKRTKDDWKQIVKQLMGAQCFVKYCQEIGKSFWNEEDFLQDYKHRFITIGHTSVSKRPTRISNNTHVNDSPDKAMKLDWPKNLPFNMLIGA
jgi:hypothetical protein